RLASVSERVRMGVWHARTLAAAVCCLTASSAGGDSRVIDLEQSTITVHVAKSGLFSAFADNHTIRAPLARGTIRDTSPLGVDIAVRTADLRVLDPNLSPAKRAEVQIRLMATAELGAAQCSEDTSASPRAHLQIKH